MHIKNKEIARLLEEICCELGRQDFLVNPYFRISKGEQEQFRKYKILNLRFPRLAILTYLVILIPINFLKIIAYISASFLFMHQYKLFNIKFAPGKILFLSHGIGKNITQKDEDQFFGNIPEHFESKGKKVTVIYTNHNKFGYIRNHKLIHSKPGAVERLLIPKFLRPMENFAYVRNINSLAYKVLIQGLRKLNNNPVKAVLLLNASIFFFSRASYSNYLVNQRVHEFYSSGVTETVIFTLEGHSYEQYIIEKTAKLFPKIKIALYQHSPIVRDHFGVEQFLKTSNQTLYIFTTGTYYKKLFESFSKTHLIEVLGSNKANLIISELTKGTVPELLFAPEGTFCATTSFINLINFLIREEPKFIFTLRLHPNVQKSFQISRQIKKLQLNSNFKISGNALHEDFARSKFVFFRSSAVGVEALKSTAIPVFYGKQEYSGLNVLGHIENLLPSINSPKEALSLLNVTSKFLEAHTKERIFGEMFSKINYDKLNLLLKN